MSHTDERTDGTTPASATTGPATGSVPAASGAPAPLLQLLQLPGLSGIDGDVPVCGPDGCAVPGARQT